MKDQLPETTDSLSVVLQRAGGDAFSALVDALRATGRLDIYLHGPDGALKEERHISNLVVTSGKGHIASLLKDRSSVNEMAFMAVGTGVGAPAVGDTDLGAEITTGLGGTRVSITRTNPSATSVKYAATWNPGQATNGAITEAGIFETAAVGPASGVMLARSTFTSIAKAAGDTLTINWTVTVS